jgi:succinyl-diaminopimelate desuccinylase
VSPALDLGADVGDLTEALVAIESVSGAEAEIADAVETALRGLPHLEVVRDGNTLVATTRLGRPHRVAIAGHLDTVAVNDNLPPHRSPGRISGLGSCDMKGGCAVALRLAATVPEPTRDITYVFYECEEVEAARNGLGRIAARSPEWLAADLAVLMEPTGALVEAGCQGTIRVDVSTQGTRAHSARSWMGENAIHRAAPVLDRLSSYQPREPDVDGLRFREGLNAVAIHGGVAGNVLPDSCTVSVNYRFAPDRTEAQALDHLREVFDGFEVAVTDSAPAARPGLEHPPAAQFVAAMGGKPRPKYGWTDVARFAVLGVPALNFGPGDPSLAHTRQEYVEISQLRSCESRMHGWLTAEDR